MLAQTLTPGFHRSSVCRLSSREKGSLQDLSKERRPTGAGAPPIRDEEDGDQGHPGRDQQQLAVCRGRQAALGLRVRVALLPTCVSSLPVPAEPAPAEPRALNGIPSLPLASPQSPVVSLSLRVRPSWARTGHRV